MNNDKELLELAAKAAGLEAAYHSQAFGMTYIAGSDNHPYTETWNPLTDDGDALRLAVKLNIVIWECNQYECALVEVRYPHSIGEVTEPIVDDGPYAATRRAIVRAAAEIGKGME